VCTKFNRKT